MERFLARDNQDDWDDDDDEDYDANDSDDEDSTVACANCGKQVYDDAEQCPYCGHFITDQDRSGGKSLLVIVGVIISLLIVAFWLMM